MAGKQWWSSQLAELVKEGEQAGVLVSLHRRGQSGTEVGVRALPARELRLCHSAAETRGRPSAAFPRPATAYPVCPALPHSIWLPRPKGLRSPLSPSLKRVPGGSTSNTCYRKGDPGGGRALALKGDVDIYTCCFGDCVEHEYLENTQRMII